MAPGAAGDYHVMLLVLLVLHLLGPTHCGAVSAWTEQGRLGQVSIYPSPSSSGPRPFQETDEPPRRHARLSTATKRSAASGRTALLSPQTSETHVGRPRDPRPTERIPSAARGAQHAASGATEHPRTAQSSTERHLSSEVRSRTLSALGCTRTNTPAGARRTGHRHNLELEKEVLMASEPGETYAPGPSALTGTRAPAHSQSEAPEKKRKEAGFPSEPGRREAGFPSEPGRREAGFPSEPGRREGDIQQVLARTERSIQPESSKRGGTIQSEPGRTEVGIPLEPSKTEGTIRSEPGRTLADIVPSEFGGTSPALWQPHTHTLLTDPEKPGFGNLSDTHVQVPPVQGSSKALPPSKPWRTEMGTPPETAESRSPLYQASPEMRTLPQRSREGLDWHGVRDRGRASKANTVGVLPSQASVRFGVQTHSELATHAPIAGKPNKRGAGTPGKPGGTRSLPEWDQAQAQLGPGRIMPAVKTPTRPVISEDWGPPGQRLARGQTISTTEASSAPNVNKTGETNTHIFSEPDAATPDALSGLVGLITEALPAAFGQAADTISGRGEAMPQSASEPGGTAMETPSGSKFVETTTKAQTELMWPIAVKYSTTKSDILRGTEINVRGNHTLQEDGWTGPYGASKQDRPGFGEQTELQSLSASNPMLVSNQDTGNNNPPVSSSDDREKRTSHTDSMYISTTFNRGGERMLLSITNGSASAEITESSMYYNISKTSDSPNSSLSESTGRTKSLKGDTYFTIDSWENFLKQSSKTSTDSSQTSSPAVESRNPTDYFHDMSVGVSNATGTSEGSPAAFSKSEHDSTVDSFSSSLGTSDSSASSSQLSESYPSTSSQAFLPPRSGVSTSFVIPAPSTLSALPSPSVTEGSSYLASASTPYVTLAPVPGFALSSSSVPITFSDVPPSLSASSSSTSHSLPSQSPSSLNSSSVSMLWSPSSPLLTSPSSASPPVERFQTSPTPLARKVPEDASPPQHYSTVKANSTPGTEDNEGLKSSTLLPSTSALSTGRFNSSSKTDVGSRTASLTEGTITVKGGFFVKTTPFLPTELGIPQETIPTKAPEQAASSTPLAPILTVQYTTLQTTSRKTVPAVSRIFETQSLEATTEFSVLSDAPTTQPVHTTSGNAIRGSSTVPLTMNTTTHTKSTARAVTPAVSFKPTHPVKSTYKIPTVTTKPSTIPALKSTAKALTTSHAAASVCSSNPCLHGGKCVQDHTTSTYKCVCTPSWTGEQCTTDVDECLSNPCPSKATCINAQGSFTCRCPLGYQLEQGAGCSLVRTFIGQIKIVSRFQNSSDWKPLERHDIEGEIAQMLSMSLSVIEGYNKSTILDTRETSDIILSIQHIFSFESNVTIYDIMRSLQSYMKSCDTPGTRLEHCRLLAQYQLYYKADSLCQLKYPECDKETSECADYDGVAICQCRPGYFKYSKMDYSCRACEDGYKRENETCVRCPFGLGGFNCGNPYQLITIVIAAAGGGLLLILGTALIITCCRKNKNDISKLIFKSGDFQMSPYAEYPKNPRSSEWGRETIEMQENGSTKNLLQVADVYYSPGLRNPELERNGLFPYTGVPGSRHSCIYPGQYNPSFLNEESRRRDYF